MIAWRRRRRREAAGTTLGVALPDGVEVEARRLRVADGLRQTFAVTGYPREVRLGWLEPLVTHPGPADVSLHVEPIPAAIAADQLRRQLARLESSRRIDAAKGRLADPALDVSATDARDLADRLARGEGRLFSVGLYATVRGGDADDLDGEATRLRGLLDSLLLDTVPATYRALPGWLTTLPIGLDLLRLRRTMDTAALAAAFPFASAELSDPSGVLWGHNARSHGLVFWDRFAQPNYNAVVLARSGAGKSYLAKLELLRSLYTGVEVAVIDPEDEYARLAHAVGGAYVHLGATGVRLNPFDLDDQPDALTRRALFLHTLIGVLLGEPLDPAARAAIDTAIIAAYTAKGISADARTHRRAAPGPGRPRRRARRCRRPGRLDAGGPTGAVRLGVAPRPLRRPDHDEPRRPPRRVQPPRPARRAQGGRHAARPRQRVAARRRPNPAPPAAGGGGRSVVVDARPGRGALSVPAGQVGPQALVRADRRHPRRRRPARERSGPGRGGQRRHPSPAPPSTPDDGRPGQRLPTDRRRAVLPPRRPHRRRHPARRHRAGGLSGRGQPGRAPPRHDRPGRSRRRRRHRRRGQPVKALAGGLAAVLLFPVLAIGAAMGAFGGAAGRSRAPRPSPTSRPTISSCTNKAPLLAVACRGPCWPPSARSSPTTGSRTPGVHAGANSAGAEGPMQFEPATFAAYARPVPTGGADPPSPYDPTDAIYAAARDLCANGGGNPATLPDAVFAYNHDDSYVAAVLDLAAQYGATDIAAPNDTAAVAVAFALAQLGTPYRWGGDGPGGFDCSGLVQAAYAAAGIELARVAQAQFDAGPPLATGTALEAGDLVFFGSGPSAVAHVGVVVGPAEMVDAPTPGPSCASTPSSRSSARPGAPRPTWARPDPGRRAPRRRVHPQARYRDPRHKERSPRPAHRFPRPPLPTRRAAPPGASCSTRPARSAVPLMGSCTCCHPRSRRSPAWPPSSRPQGWRRG